MGTRLEARDYHGRWTSGGSGGGTSPHEHALMEASRAQREGVAKVHAKMAAQQKGEAFKDLHTNSKAHAKSVPSEPGSVAGPVAGVVAGLTATALSGVGTGIAVGYLADTAVRHLASAVHGHADVVKRGRK